MALNNNYILKNVGNDYMLIPILSGNVDVSRIFNLTETGAFIYRRLQLNLSVEQIIKEMLEAYDIDEKTAKADFDNFIDKLKKLGVYND